MELTKQLTALFLISVIATAFAACDREAAVGPERRQALADEMEEVLLDELHSWYPRAVDTLHGGFLSRFTYNWTPEDPQDKMIVTQARHVWTTSKAAQRYPNDPRYASAAEHGCHVLRDVMWDEVHGGFFNLVTRDGTPIPDENGRLMKLAYGNAFGIFAVAAYHGATQDTSALNLAKRAFQWLEEHSHDPSYGGYYQFMEENGIPFSGGYGARADGRAATPPKDQNSSIHLLEAFTELYAVWPDPLVRQRLEEMFELIRDTMVSETGYLRLFFDKHWTPISFRDSSAAVREANYQLDHVSFGHDVETAYLLLEAEHALLGENTAQTETMARRMVDHALRYGWDKKYGGFYDRGYYFHNERPEIILETKNWWTQVEALNTLSMMGLRYPDQGYNRRMVHQWLYVKENLIDSRFGGLYETGLREDPEAEEGLKGHIWKGNYHTVRSLMNTIDRLRGMSDEAMEIARTHP